MPMTPRESLTVMEHGTDFAEKSGRKKSMSVTLSRKTTHHMMVTSHF